jgi:hypothetical protein
MSDICGGRRLFIIWDYDICIKLEVLQSLSFRFIHSP